MSSKTRSETLVCCVRQGKRSLVEGELYADTQSGEVGEAFVYECHGPHTDCTTLCFTDGRLMAYRPSFERLRMPTAREKTRYYRERWEYARG